MGWQHGPVLRVPQENGEYLSLEDVIRNLAENWGEKTRI